MDSSNPNIKNNTTTTFIVDNQSLNGNSSFHHYNNNSLYHQQQNLSSMNQTSGNNINNNSNGQILVPSQTTTAANTIATGTTTANAENPKTLYVGNLDSSINETFIHTLFASFGHINGLKLITDNQNDLYCFIEYEDHSSAATAILTMNKRLCLDREMKVNWASNSSGASGQKTDTSKHFHIFVGDLSPEIETQQLREAFTVFGEISDCRVVRDSHTFKSKGYGFVSFVKRQDAENAIAGMNGQWLGHRPIRTNWATRKMTSLKGSSGGGIGSVGISSNDNNMVIGPNVNNRTMKYDEVFNSSSITNCTVYCGGIINGLTEELMQKTFCRFGTIQEIRVFKEKGYAFIKFTCKEAATNAIVMMNNQEILGQTVKCSWGKETNDAVSLMGMPTTTSNLNAAAVAAAVAAQANLAAAAATTPLIYPYGHHTHPQQQLSYWYQPTAFQTAAAIHAGHPQATPASQHPSSVAAATNHHHHHHPHHQTQYTTVQTTPTGLQYPYNQHHQYYSSMAAAVAAGQTPSAAAGFNTSPMAIPISAAWTTQPPLASTLTNNSSSAASGYPTIQGYQAQ